MCTLSPMASRMCIIRNATASNDSAINSNAINGIVMSETIEATALIMEYFSDDTGRLTGKIEGYGEHAIEYAYQYAATGHLTSVVRDVLETESYQYNQLGQRSRQRTDRVREYHEFPSSTNGELYYDEEGQLIHAGETSFKYDEWGALSERRDNWGITKYFYGDDTMLDTVTLPSGIEISYEYDESNPIGPARRFKNGIMTAELVWENPLRLSAYRDHEYLLDYSFAYADNGHLDMIRLTPFLPEKQSDAGDEIEILVTQGDADRWERLQDFFDEHTTPLELVCGSDQVGTLKILSTKNGEIIKEIQYDSFGLHLSDSFPDLFMPIGFAGGLVDSDTGLVRFGYRDYDPTVGRFTAPDPLGDTGGDHDLYDYCIDDPINLNDPSGLFPPLLLFVGGQALAAGLGFGVPYGITKVIDFFTENDNASNSMHKIAPIVGATVLAGATPGLAAFGPGAITALGQRAGAVMLNSPHVSKVKAVGEALEGYFVPGGPRVLSGWTAAGASATELNRKFNK